MHVNARIYVRSFKYERRLGEFGVPGNTTERLSPNVALADVPVAIYSRVVFDA